LEALELGGVGPDDGHLAVGAVTPVVCLCSCFCQGACRVCTIHIYISNNKTHARQEEVEGRRRHAPGAQQQHALLLLAGGVLRDSDCGCCVGGGGGGRGGVDLGYGRLRRLFWNVCVVSKHQSPTPSRFDHTSTHPQTTHTYIHTYIHPQTHTSTSSNSAKAWTRQTRSLSPSLEGASRSSTMVDLGRWACPGRFGRTRHSLLWCDSWVRREVSVVYIGCGLGWGLSG
jgi:hypothetical protein